MTNIRLTNLAVSLALMLPLIATAIALAGEYSVTAKATVQKYISVIVNYTEVDFGSVSAPSTDNTPVNLDQSLGQFNDTVKTNYDYKISAKVSGIPSGVTHKFYANQDKTQATSVANAVSLTDAYQAIYTATVSAGGTYVDYHGHWLDVSETARADSYTWTLYLLYENL